MFESSIRSSSTKRTGAERGEQSRRYYYERLMQVSVRNTFYNASGDLCPDFQIRPTSASVDLMRSLGLLFKDEGTGFSILLDSLRSKQFVDYVRKSGAWTRISFILTLENGNFFNFTDIPLRMSPSTRTFYLSNMEAGANAQGEVLLNPDRPGERFPVPLTGSQYRVSVTDKNAQWVIASGISGEVALREPVYGPGPDPVRRDPIYLDFSLLPEGKYRIQQCENLGENLDGDCDTSSPALSDLVVYAYSGRPLIFVDLLFTNPGVSGGVYPIDETGAVVPAQYYLDFERRSTFWNYYVVSTGAPLSELQIETVAPSSSQLTFSGPTAVELPGSQKASLFVSNSAIPLQEQSDYHFQLLGRAGGVEMRNGVLMDRLPVASSLQVLPGDGDFATSDSGSSGKSADRSPARNFSDIYVYV